MNLPKPTPARRKDTMIRALGPTTRRGSRWAALLSGGLVSALLATVPALLRAADTAAPAAGPALVHFAFSKSLFADVNENDAKAAVKVYSRILASENGVSTGDGAVVLDGTNAIADALRHQQIDLLSLTTMEFLALEHLGLEGPLLVTTIRQSASEEFVLLVRESDTLRRVEDLQGRSLIVLTDVRASLARIWLEVLCREHGLGPEGNALAKITHGAKATLVVLPVFFGKVDACVVTRHGWELMGELNPQVKRQLRVLAVSPPVIPVLTCFPRGASDRLKQRILEAAESSVDKPSFKQLMALFKTERLVRQPLSVLASTRELVATHHRLGGGMNPAQPPVPDPVRPRSATEGSGQ